MLLKMLLLTLDTVMQATFASRDHRPKLLQMDPLDINVQEVHIVFLEQLLKRNVFRALIKI